MRLSTALIMGLLLAMPSVAADGVTRIYYMAADEVEWDYAPSGINQITGQPFGEEEAFVAIAGPHLIGRVYRKAIYREYTDATFSELKPRPPEWEHLGILGPLLRAEVGDTIEVVFRNNASFPASLHPHGVFYDKDSEGAPYNDGTSGSDQADDGVPTGGTHTYVWPVPERAGPVEGGLSTAFWMYHSHTNEMRDVNAGLMGPMLVTARGSSKSDLSPQDVDREFIIEFGTMSENDSWFIDHNIQIYMSDPGAVELTPSPFGVVIESPSGTDGNFMESLNGFVYGNLPMLTMYEGETVRWYLMANTNFEVHAPHWHGNTVVQGNMRTDVTSLLTMGMQIVDMEPDNLGTWLFHCHVAPHFAAGMIARYQVLPADAKESTATASGSGGL